MIEQLYTKKEIAKLLGFSIRTIEKMMKSGELMPVKVSKSIRFRESDVKKLIQAESESVIDDNE